MSITDKTILVTGGTGSFGQAFIKKILKKDIQKAIVLSRDELKQFEMRQAIKDSRLRFFIGDVRDRDRLYRAFDGVDIIIHAAAMKQVPACEYNPFEAIKTNIIGAQNVIEAAIDMNVKRVIALSTDKAANPINLYGATKLCSDKLFLSTKAYVGDRDIKFSVVRYGNVMGSRGSVIPLFKNACRQGKLPITDPRMTRFWITLDQGTDFVLMALARMKGEEIFVPKIPSMKVTDLAKALAPDCEFEFVGIRPGEKIHEALISEEDARHTLEYEHYYVVFPHHYKARKQENGGKAVPLDFSYTSDTNTWWLTVDELRRMAEN